jgi:outer membrane protein assembly factor BamB
MAVSLESGEVLWKTPNPRGWKMTHSSVVAMEIGGQKTFVYCGSGGVVGVSALDGRQLWETDAWKISIATVPTPVVIPGNRLFFSGGYNAGSLMIRLEPAPDGGALSVTELFRLKASAFGATQHTPILYQNHLYGIHPDGPLVCLDLEGQTLWSSEEANFGLGPLLLADSLIFALNDTGTLAITEATPASYKQLASSAILEGREAWAPMALAADRLLLRDLTELVCLEVGTAK